MLIKLNLFLLVILSGISSLTLADEITDDSSTVYGLINQYTPRYSGSNEYFWKVSPLFQIRKKAFFIDTTKGIGYDLATPNGFYLEHSLGYSFGRSDQKSNWKDGANNLKGMGNIKGSLNTSIALGWQLKSWLIPEIKAIMPLTESQGSKFQGSLTLIPVQTSTNTLAIETSVSAADARYMNTYYGVNSIQHERSGYRKYNTQVGLLGVQLDINWIHQYNRHWSTMLGTTYNWLGNKAVDSSLHIHRNTNTVNFGILYNY